MGKKVALVTGSNRGLGFEIVRQLCKKFDGDVYLTARDVSKGEAAVEELKKDGLSPLFHQLDVTSTESIKTCHDFLVNKYGSIAVLVNNAGVDCDAGEGEIAAKTEFGVRVNFTGLKDVCQTFMKSLSKGARVVSISDRTGFSFLGLAAKHLTDRITSPDLTMEQLEELMAECIRDTKAGDFLEKGWINATYDVTKAGVTALTRLLQKQIDDTRPDDNILINCCCPGAIQTDMMGAGEEGMKDILLTVEEGAETPVYLALLPESALEPRGELLARKKVLPFTAGLEQWAKVMKEFYFQQPEIVTFAMNFAPDVKEPQKALLADWEKELKQLGDQE